MRAELKRGDIVPHRGRRGRGDNGANCCARVDKLASAETDTLRLLHCCPAKNQSGTECDI
jgi:hypothetical protein